MKRYYRYFIITFLILLSIVSLVFATAFTVFGVFNAILFNDSKYLLLIIVAIALRSISLVLLGVVKYFSNRWGFDI